MMRGSLLLPLDTALRIAEAHHGADVVDILDSVAAGLGSQT